MKIPTTWGQVIVPFEKLKARLAEELPNVAPVRREAILKGILDQAINDALLQSLLEATAVITGQAEIAVPVVDANTGLEPSSEMVTLNRLDVAKNARRTASARLLRALLASSEPHKKTDFDYQLLLKLLNAISHLPDNKQTKTALALKLNLGSEATKSGLTMLGRVLDRLGFPAEHRKTIEAINLYGIHLLFSQKVNSEETRNNA